MYSYIIRRLLLVIPTFFGITIMIFLILQIMPGGPVEQAIFKAQFGSGGEQGGENFNSTRNKENASGLSPEAIKKLKEIYGQDKPLLLRYPIWMGLMRRDVNINRLKSGNNIKIFIRNIYDENGNKIGSLQRWLKLAKDKNGKISVYESGVGSNVKLHDSKLPPKLPRAKQIPISGWKLNKSWYIEAEANGNYKIYQKKFRGVLQGYMGESFTYNEPVMTTILRKMPISLYFGLIGFILTYGISIPLGVTKGIFNGSKGDIITTFLVFLGYSIPGYVLGIVLILFLTGGGYYGYPLFPVGGFVSANFEQLSLLGKIIDLLKHTTLPLIAWNIGSFANLTMLMKNTILDELSQDYVRTAFAKGLSDNKVIYRHVFKNALVPIAPGVASFFFIFFSGAMLLEITFNIQGMGLLSYQAMLTRDYPVVLAFIAITTVMSLLVGILADLMYAVVDPRIRFS